MDEVKSAAQTLCSAEERDSWISSEDFLEAYDVRAYDFNNDCYDIKVMKGQSFEGGYILWNKSRSVACTGVGCDVYKKVERHFRGYGNQSVYDDYCQGDEFLIHFVKLSNSDYTYTEPLGEWLKGQYGEYPPMQIDGQTPSKDEEPDVLDRQKDSSSNLGCFRIALIAIVSVAACALLQQCSMLPLWLFLF